MNVQLPILVVDKSDECSHEARLAARIRVVVIGEDEEMQLAAMVVAIRQLGEDMGLSTSALADFVEGGAAPKGRLS